MEIHNADAADLSEIAGILDAAYLQIDIDSLRDRISVGTVLVAEATRNSAADAEHTGAVLGVLVLDGETITAIAVRPGRRGQGIGSALVGEAKTRQERLIAEFDPTVRPFWKSVGFVVSEQSGSERLRGISR
ncbi:MAG: GNAT family N-acetyltransferase [Halovenus sp.]|uniref:GNAT family N-acetyltransferase n=1 Tax=Halovenus amylolytica TaxID=2500550 RepID=UPI000FE3A3E6